jgi:predicted XRE-type DNA-binding protein
VVAQWIVDVTPVEDWLLGLDQATYQQVIAALELLAERGPLLGRPLVDTITGSRHNNMKELRPGSAGRSERRVLLAFDPHRVAVLLMGGDKAGRWKRWYSENHPDRRRPIRPAPRDTDQRRPAMTTLDDLLAKRPVDRAAVDMHKAQMRAEVRVHALRELRVAQHITQVDLAGILHVAQTRVSAIERGDIERASIDTLRRYAEAIGGHLRVEVEIGDDRIQIA